jgi:hypothetical protein
MTLADWLDAMTDALGVDLDVDVDGLLDVARIVAHAIDRPAAPLSTFLIGYAAAQRGGGEAKVRACMDLASALAREHQSD